VIAVDAPDEEVPRPCLSLPLEHLHPSTQRGEGTTRPEEEEEEEEAAAEAAAVVHHRPASKLLRAWCTAACRASGRAWTRTAQSATAPPAKSASVDLPPRRRPPPPPPPPPPPLPPRAPLSRTRSARSRITAATGRACSRSLQSHGGRLCSERSTSSATAAPPLPRRLLKSSSA
jgi:hypothetical protein